jgi:hypothetical protein
MLLLLLLLYTIDILPKATQYAITQLTGDTAAIILDGVKIVQKKQTSEDVKSMI